MSTAVFDEPLTLNTAARLLSGNVDVPDEEYLTQLTKYPPIVDRNTGNVRTKFDADTLLRYAPIEKLQEAVQSSEDLRNELRARDRLRAWSTLSPLDAAHIKDVANVRVLKAMAGANAAALYDEQKRRELAALSKLYENKERTLVDNARRLEQSNAALMRFRDKSKSIADELTAVDNEIRTTKPATKEAKESLAQLEARRRKVVERLKRNTELLNRKEREADEWKLIVENERSDEYTLRKKIEESLNRALTKAVGWPYRKNDANYDPAVQKLIDDRLGGAYQRLEREIKAYEASQRSRFQDLVEDA